MYLIRILLSITAVSTLASATANAQQSPVLFTQPRLRQITSVEADGAVKTTEIRYITEERIRIVKDPVSGNERRIEETVEVPVLEPRELRGVAFYNMQGELLDIADVRKRITGRMPVVETQGAPLEQGYRELFKDNALNMVINKPQQ